ncbi:MULTISPECIES: hypothetical protein [unclassified Rhodococcus (in: high G+C Gram-positive bacteria)]|uniref:hypothetical protein n=1 Tax=unclassified Rhodococcus (in: high G+C Gram-positive bacteria) TaxID=192944 RepID=UPI001FF87083|nr:MULTISPECIES: hypothetical protein [unclassified Rhodococcus (in: high G+C Gram-positive bacteria)]
MTITAGSAGTRRTRRTRATSTETGAARSGAALRAYERRQQRATVYSGDATTSSHGAARLSLSGASMTARIPFVALIIGLLSLGLGLTLLLTTRSAGDSYDLSDAKAYNEGLVQERASLQRDVELADSAPELARRAAEMGMVPAGNVARLVVAPDGSVQVIGTPAPAEGKPVAPLDPPDSQSVSPTQSPPSVTPRSASSPTRPTPATPNTSIDARAGALGEQLVPMSTQSESPSPDNASGSRQ